MATTGSNNGYVPQQRQPGGFRLPTVPGRYTQQSVMQSSYQPHKKNVRNLIAIMDSNAVVQVNHPHAAATAMNPSGGHPVSGPYVVPVRNVSKAEEELPSLNSVKDEFRMKVQDLAKPQTTPVAVAVTIKGKQLLVDVANINPPQLGVNPGRLMVAPQPDLPLMVPITHGDQVVPTGGCGVPLSYTPDLLIPPGTKPRRYDREYLLQIRSKEECQFAPPELLGKDCFKKNDTQYQGHGGGGGGGRRRGSRQRERNEPRKIIPHSASESSNEKDKLQVQLKLPEEERRGLEKERKVIPDQSKDFCSQFQKASEECERMASRLGVHQSCMYVKKEHAQRETLLTENVKLKAEKNSPQQEKRYEQEAVLSIDSLTMKLAEATKEISELRQQVRNNEETNQWRERYEQLINETETAKENASKKIRQLQDLLYSSQENTRLQEQEYYSHIEKQKNTIRSLESSIHGLEVELKRADEEKNQLKMDIMQCKVEYEYQRELLLRDLALKTAEMKEAQKQHAESERRQQQMDADLILMKKKFEELKNEKSHADQQLCVYLKGLEDERQARELQFPVTENLKKTLAEAKQETVSLSHQLHRQADHIGAQLEEEQSLQTGKTLSLGCAMGPRRDDLASHEDN